MPSHRTPAVHLTFVGPQATGIPPVTTSTQQTVLTEQEIEFLRGFAAGAGNGDPARLVALAAKGMIDDAEAAIPALTPAGQHALQVGSPGTVPGIDT